MKSQLQAAAIPAGTLPEGNYFVEFFYPPWGAGRRAKFTFPERDGLWAMLSVGASVCGWKLEKLEDDYPLKRFDGFATLRSREGKSLQLWTHVRNIPFGDPPIEMPFDQWVHHEKQLDAALYRARHAIRVIEKPDGQPNDPAVRFSDPAPESARVPPEPPADSGERVRVRGAVQAAIGRRLPAGLPLPEMDFYLTAVDAGKRATFRFPGAPGISVEANVGDTVCGWILHEVPQQAGPSEFAVLLRAADDDKATFELWNRLDLPIDGPPIKIDAVKWERHRIESEANRAKAEGRLVVVESPATTRP